MADIMAGMQRKIKAAHKEIGLFILQYSSMGVSDHESLPRKNSSGFK
jgi:hypothetical protein